MEEIIIIGWLFKGKVLRAANMEIDYTRRDNHLLSGGIVSQLKEIGHEVGHMRKKVKRWQRLH